jgi:hypothetical protein
MPSTACPQPTAIGRPVEYAAALRVHIAVCCRLRRSILTDVLIDIGTADTASPAARTTAAAAAPVSTSTTAPAAGETETSNSIVADD